MARMNTAPTPGPRTHNGAPATRPRTTLSALRRSVLSCLLWEREAYEKGEEIATRIRRLAREADPHEVAALAIEARKVHNLRHAPLWLTLALVEKGGLDGLTAATIETVISRADEITEMLAMYWEGAKRPIPSTVPRALKQGLSRALRKFNAYALAKYDRDSAVRFKHVMQMVHPRPRNAEESALWKQLLDGTLPTPDTWETALSSGADKKETWTRLLREETLGYDALLKNLRNMTQANVDVGLVRQAILARKGAHRIQPFRYTAAARACPQFEPQLDEALCAAIEDLAPLSGETIVLVDVSGSMNNPLAEPKGKKPRRPGAVELPPLTRMDAAATLASMIPGKLRVFTFSEQLVEVPPRRGMAGVDAVIKSQSHSNTFLGAAIKEINRLPHDRLIVITDEQSSDPVGRPTAPRPYLINVASDRFGVSDKAPWIHMDGFSEGVLRYIAAMEKELDVAE